MACCRTPAPSKTRVDVAGETRNVTIITPPFSGVENHLVRWPPSSLSVQISRASKFQPARLGHHPPQQAGATMFLVDWFYGILASLGELDRLRKRCSCFVFFCKNFSTSLLGAHHATLSSRPHSLPLTQTKSWQIWPIGIAYSSRAWASQPPGPLKQAALKLQGESTLARTHTHATPPFDPQNLILPRGPIRRRDISLPSKPETDRP